MLQIGGEIPGLLTLEHPVLHNNTEILQREPLQVKTPEQAWAYAVAFEVHQTQPGSDLEHTGIAVDLGLNVQAGEVCVGGLTHDLQEFVSAETVVKPRGPKSVVRVFVSQPRKFHWLMLRNGASGDRAAVFWLHSISCYLTHGEELADLVEVPVPQLRNQLSSIILPR
jgi:hypothetical protein